MNVHPLLLFAFSDSAYAEEVRNIFKAHRIAVDYPLDYAITIPADFSATFGAPLLLSTLYGEYGGPVGSGLQKPSVDKEELKRNIAKKHPKWPARKIERATDNKLKALTGRDATLSHIYCSQSIELERMIAAIHESVLYSDLLLLLHSGPLDSLPSDIAAIDSDDITDSVLLNIREGEYLRIRKSLK